MTVRFDQRYNPQKLTFVMSFVAGICRSSRDDQLRTIVCSEGPFYERSFFHWILAVIAPYRSDPLLMKYQAEMFRWRFAATDLVSQSRST